jgi:hypothetical protein
VENLGLSLGYTGYVMHSDANDIDNVLWNGVDLRAQWAGIPGLSISTHNNVSFAQGAEKDWLGMLGKDSSFFTLYNAVGVTKELTEKFSINAEIGNVYTKLSFADDDIDSDNLWGQLKFIASPVENAEFSIGLRYAVQTQTDADTASVFSVPIGITVSF